jgi:hypothetical protein
MTRSKRTLARALAALALAAGMTVAVAAPANAACYPVDGHFANRHSMIWQGIGCAVGWAGATGNGLFQNFERGQMIWSPSQGGGMVVSVYRYWEGNSFTGIAFHWGPSNPYNYQKWLIRLDRNGANLGQWECLANWGLCSRTDGFQLWGGQPQGYAYRVVVEGCDVDAWNGHTCRQGWTMPVWLFV